jgi:hypothetical protein
MFLDVILLAFVPLPIWIGLNVVAIVFAIYIRKGRRKKPLRGIDRLAVGKYSATIHEEHYGVVCSTLKGELVRSGAEKTIADYLYQKGIRYDYESPAYGLNGQLISRPDFYLPDYHVYVEYWGMLEVQDPRKRAEYVESMNWKLGKYARNNIKCLSLYHEDLADLNKTLHDRLLVHGQQ